MATSTSSRALPLPRRASTSLKHEEILLLIRDCDALLQSEPRCLHTRAVRGHACMKAKLWERAVADFTEILEARPDDVHARFSRGMALFKDARIGAAHEEFSRVLELNPHHVMARYARHVSYRTPYNRLSCLL
jgi:lipoprotein NlpI